MAKTKKELTNILNALTGETHAEHEFNSKAEIIGEISKNTSGGGGEPEIFWINATMGEGITLDKTFAEITAAVEDGKYPIVKALGTIFPMSRIVDNSVVFEQSLKDGSAIHSVSLVLSSNNSVEVEEVEASKYQPFIVEMTPGETEGTFVSTTTYGEAWAAIQSGKTVILKLGEAGVIPVLTATNSDSTIRLDVIMGTVVELEGASTDTISYTPGG